MKISRSPEKLMILIATVQNLIQAQFPQWSHLPISKIEPGDWNNKPFRLGKEIFIRMPSGVIIS